jgi:hypothetical protein
MNRLNQRLVAAEQVEGDEGRGLTVGQVVPVTWRLGRPSDHSPDASSAILAGRSRAGGRCPCTRQRRSYRVATAVSKRPPSG